ncbi:hypothetical protein I204_08190 [Kwoniella mangroviensis CBS 8886]|uniref:uncharacterized protein n=1 Tax=Kwoniella mangroviensis CBS 8507 TaxID=1296122 RepID=UPI00080D7BDE|nr:uncharacterized protein I203_04449 [Kwoniella mangroviensis CBS 8507]OCF66123.1 hypothetical protein I203_04449 [Kwoniella mangroviensis CBS 8507]OCF71237.1 hypothetical protein I204_08190 [Kwoniella mangroviensis CBS 8886]
MIVEITLLLLLILVEAPLVGEDDRGRCECDCSCGKKYHLNSSYPEVLGDGGDGVSEDIRGNESSDRDVEHEQEPIYVGGSDGEGWNDRSKPYSERSLVTGNRKDYSNRPRPPHLDRSVPDRKPPYLVTNNSRKRKDGHWCAPCQRYFVDSLALQQHQVALHSATTTIMSSSSRNQIPRNVRSLIPELNHSVVVCEVCSEGLPNVTALDMHKVNFHPWSIFCPECLIRFRHAQEAQFHYRQFHHARSPDPLHIDTMLGLIKGHHLIHPSLQTLPFTPQQNRPQHQVQTFPTHTIQNYYECEECNMVFGRPQELEAHKATPLVHGGRIYEADDFPPLGSTAKPSSSPSPSVTASSPDDLAVEGNLTVWGMPSFTLNEKRSDAMKEEVWTPQARLTPEPDSSHDTASTSSEETNSTDVVLDFQRVASESETNDMESIDPEDIDTPMEGLSAPKQISDIDAQHTDLKQDKKSQSYDNEITGTIKTIEPNSGPVEANPLGPAEDSTNSAKAIVTDDIIQVRETNKIFSQVVSSAQSLHTISPRPVIQPVPSQINLTPYAKAALASAHKISEYPPPEMDVGDNEKYEDDSPEVIGGIECHVPSFALTLSPQNKTTSLESPPLSLDSTPPLTLSGDSSSSLNESLVLEEEDDAWAASQEVYTIANSHDRQMFSLDLGATSNGNRPKPKSYSESSSSSKSTSSRHRNKRSERSCNTRRQTYLTPSQREVYGYAISRNERRDSSSSSSSRSKAPPQASLQPMFESEWSTITPMSSGNRSMGGRIIKESPWEASRREAEERNRLVSAGGAEEDLYGGW